MTERTDTKGEVEMRSYRSRTADQQVMKEGRLRGETEQHVLGRASEKSEGHRSKATPTPTPDPRPPIKLKLPGSQKAREIMEKVARSRRENEVDADVECEADKKRARNEIEPVSGGTEGQLLEGIQNAFDIEMSRAAEREADQEATWKDDEPESAEAQVLSPSWLAERGAESYFVEADRDDTSSSFQLPPMRYEDWPAPSRDHAQAPASAVTPFRVAPAADMQPRTKPYVGKTAKMLQEMIPAGNFGHEYSFTEPFRMPGCLPMVPYAHLEHTKPPDDWWAGQYDPGREGSA